MLNFRTVAVTLAAGTVAFAATRPLLQMQMPTATEQHAEIQRSVGQWEGTVTMHMPGMPVATYPATETVTAAGPFWIMSHFKSEFMGMPYEGHGVHGYDPDKSKYVSTWVDNASPYLSIMEGNEANGMLVMEWDAPDMTGKMAPHRSEQKHAKDAYSMTFYTAGQKTMVIDMKRSKGMVQEASAPQAR